jgi:hypothetical protein
MNKVYLKTYGNIVETQANKQQYVFRTSDSRNRPNHEIIVSNLHF